MNSPLNCSTTLDLNAILQDLILKKAHVITVKAGSERNCMGLDSGAERPRIRCVLAGHSCELHQQLWRNKHLGEEMGSPIGIA